MLINIASSWNMQSANIGFCTWFCTEKLVLNLHIVSINVVSFNERQVAIEIALVKSSQINPRNVFGPLNYEWCYRNHCLGQINCAKVWQCARGIEKPTQQTIRYGDTKTRPESPRRQGTMKIPKREKQISNPSRADKFSSNHAFYWRRMFQVERCIWGENIFNVTTFQGFPTLHISRSRTIHSEGVSM